MQHPVLDWVVSSFHLPDPGVERWSPALQADALLSEPPGNPKLASLVAQLVNLSTVWETQVLSLGWEDPLEKGKAVHSSILGLPLWLSW